MTGDLPQLLVREDEVLVEAPELPLPLPQLARVLLSLFVARPGPIERRVNRAPEHAGAGQDQPAYTNGQNDDLSRVRAAQPQRHANHQAAADDQGSRPGGRAQKGRRDENWYAQG